jgi:hypothetical protein
MSKLKRPEKIQTSSNGTTSATSPALSAKKTQPGQMPPASSTSNGGGINGTRPRTVSRPRQDAPPQLLARGQRTSSAGLRSASIVVDAAVATNLSEPRPYSEIMLTLTWLFVNGFQSSPIVIF